MSRRRKKKSPLGGIVLVVLLILLAGFIVYRFLSYDPTMDSEKNGETTLTPNGESSALDISATAAPSLPPDTSVNTPSPVPTPTPVITPTPVPTPTPRPAVILENEGELEIIIPDEMESDGV